MNFTVVGGLPFLVAFRFAFLVAFFHTVHKADKTVRNSGEIQNKVCHHLFEANEI